MSKILFLGADPEIIVKSAATNLPSHMIGLIGGTKEKPLPCLNGALQEDNVLLEFNINPASTEDMFVNHIKAVMEQGADLAAKHGRVLTELASVSFDEASLAQLPPEAWVFGCEPDSDALTGMQNAAPCAADKGLRSAGGHIHVGHESLTGNEFIKRDMIITMDYLLGLWSVTRDADLRRRELYGKASAYRSKSYGVEYRTLSNFWIFKESDIRQAYQLTLQAFNSLEHIEELLAMADVNEVRNAINTGDQFFADRTLNMISKTL